MDLFTDTSGKGRDDGDYSEVLIYWEKACGQTHGNNLINLKEIRVVFFALKKINFLKGSIIFLHSDNTIVNCLNRRLNKVGYTSVVVEFVHSKETPPLKSNSC